MQSVLAGVLAYDRVDDCVETVQHLLAQDHPAQEVLVVDNASPRGVGAAVAARCPGVRHERNEANLGFAGGMNSILDRAVARGFDYALLCNDDVSPAPDATSRLVATARAHPDAGVIGGVEVGWTTGATRAVGGSRFGLILGRETWQRRVPDQVVRVAFPQGAFLLVPTDAVRAGLRFDDTLFMYYEDVDLGLRASRLGRSVLVDPSVRLRHKAEGRPLAPRNAYFQQRNRVHLVRRHGTRGHLCAHVTYVAALELPVKVAMRTLQGHFAFARACVAGFVDGVRGRGGPGRAFEWG